MNANDKQIEVEELGFVKRFVLKLREFFAIDGVPLSNSYTAKEASLYAYDSEIILNDEKRKRHFIRLVNEQIKSKCVQQQTNCTYDLPWHLLKYEDEITKYFKDKGYDIHNLRKETDFVHTDILYINWEGKV